MMGKNQEYEASFGVTNRLKFFLTRLRSNLVGYRRRTKSGKNPIPYDGNLFDRFNGMELILSNCDGASVLDFGACDGLISYEFARNGAKVIHGFDYDGPRMDFARTLFGSVPVESKFLQADLAVTGDRFEKKYANTLLKQYDIVLFLGIFHHLKNQMSLNDLHNLTDHLLDKTKKWFVVRTNTLPEFEDWILAKDFKVIHESRDKGVGLLKLFERNVS